jgi:hypothetical protein
MSFSIRLPSLVWFPESLTSAAIMAQSSAHMLPTMYARVKTRRPTASAGRGIRLEGILSSPEAATHTSHEGHGDCDPNHRILAADGRRRVFRIVHTRHCSERVCNERREKKKGLFNMYIAYASEQLERNKLELHMRIQTLDGGRGDAKAAKGRRRALYWARIT